MELKVREYFKLSAARCGDTNALGVRCGDTNALGARCGDTNAAD